jgi:hypothetical protein
VSVIPNGEHDCGVCCCWSATAAAGSRFVHLQGCYVLCCVSHARAYHHSSALFCFLHVQL